MGQRSVKSIGKSLQAFAGYSFQLALRSSIAWGLPRLGASMARLSKASFGPPASLPLTSAPFALSATAGSRRQSFPLPAPVSGALPGRAVSSERKLSRRPLRTWAALSRLLGSRAAKDDRAVGQSRPSA
eukprot:2781658-Alexandrium_andersonii.AAC.1